MAAFARVVAQENRISHARLEEDTWLLLTRPPWEGVEETGEMLPAAGATLAAPVTPSKIICVGRNYRAHAKELGHEVPAEPLLFFKPPSAIVAPGEPIVLPAASERVDHEAELGVVIGKRCRDVSEERALSHVFGYTAVNDVTARDLQKKDGQWARAKGFDSFCPVGPIVVTKLDPQALRVRCRVNGAVRQDGATADMIFSIARIVSYVSGIMTLEPGDLIATGTPEGVGALAAGDVVEVDVESVGILRNPVMASPR
jgi:2-keto-4-pentenoate hydratase/2-oxohepta-3-ene-1,7-dioic acid hydratase in catechol pathway